MKLNLGITKILKYTMKELGIARSSVESNGVEIIDRDVDATKNASSKIICTYLANTVVCYKVLENGLIKVA